MYDWITATFTIKHEPRKFVRLIDKQTGEYREFPQAVKLGKMKKSGGRNSDGVLKAQFLDNGTKITFSGNYTKYVSGQSVIGTTKLNLLVIAGAEKAFEELDIRPTKKEWARIIAGEYVLSRVDIAGYIPLASPLAKSPVIEAVRRVVAPSKASFSAQGRHFIAIDRPKRKRLSLYDKTKESRGFRGLPKEIASDRCLLQYIDRSLRAELRLRSTELSRLGLRHGSDWKDVRPRTLVMAELEKIGVVDRRIKPFGTKNISDMSRRQFMEWTAWKSGVNILAQLPRTLRQQRIKEFGAYGLDVRLPYVDQHNSRTVHSAFRRVVVGCPKRLRRSRLLRHLWREESPG